MEVKTTMKCLIVKKHLDCNRTYVLFHTNDKEGETNSLENPFGFVGLTFNTVDVPYEEDNDYELSIL